MSLLTIQNLTCHLGDKTLYQQASFTLFAGEHIGVTGKNGVGKSTLLKLIQAELLPDGATSSGSLRCASVIWISMPRWTRKQECANTCKPLLQISTGRRPR